MPYNTLLFEKLLYHMTVKFLLVLQAQTFTSRILKKEWRVENSFLFNDQRMYCPKPRTVFYTSTKQKRYQTSYTSCGFFLGLSFDKDKSFRRRVVGCGLSMNTISEEYEYSMSYYFSPYTM